MSHLSQQIRAALIARLTGLPLTGSHVAGRGHVFADGVSGAIRIFYADESRNRQPVDGPSLATPMAVRTAAFTLESVALTSGDIDDALDAQRLQIEPALMLDRKLGGIARDLRIADGPARDTDLTGAKKSGTDTFTIEVDYLCRDASPDVSVAVA